MPGMTPEFFEQAAMVMNSPYFYERSTSNKPKDVVEFDRKRDAERDTLQDAFEHCSDYKDLKGEPKAIFDRAVKSIEEWERDSEARFRLSEDEISIGFSQEAIDAAGPSPENTSLLVEAIAQAVAAGDMKAADRLAELGKDPDKLQAILDAAEAEEPYAEQAADEEAELPQPKRSGVKPSPFKKSMPYQVKGQGEPCKQGETAEQSGCIPASGETTGDSTEAVSSKPASKKPKAAISKVINGNDWLHSYVLGAEEGTDATGKWTEEVSGLPSDEVIREFAQYVPDKPITLYRYVPVMEGSGSTGQELKSWSKTEEFPESLLNDLNDGKGKVVKKLFYPNEILVDTTMLSEDQYPEMNNSQQEVIVAYGKTLKRMKQLRGTNATVPPSPFTDRKTLSPFKGRKSLDKDQTNKLMSTIRSLAGSPNLIPIAKLRQALAPLGYASQSEQDAVIQQLRSRFLISASGPEGRHGSTPEERASWMRAGSETIAFISVRR